MAISALAPMQEEVGRDAGRTTAHHTNDGRWPLVLLIDGQEALHEAMASRFGSEGIILEFASNAREGLLAAEQLRPDLVLLDPALPDQSGLDLLQNMHAAAPTPVIIITTEDSETEAVRGLELGAADYVLKPFRVRELVARIRAVLRRRRVTIVYDDLLSRGLLQEGSITLDLDCRQVCVDGIPVAMSRIEFDLLNLLMERAGQVVTRESCLDVVWRDRELSDTRTLDTHVKRIRSKIEVDPRNPRRVTTFRGVGYRFESAALSNYSARPV